ncbi:MAG: sigma-54-dependent Fis family transcriptional regulator [Syntrophus sp. (in: bacteria)]|nr:sigma-54-dependent Fis family transcriptional regulator [Syntrophus sp. (in: bacteria)]
MIFSVYVVDDEETIREGIIMALESQYRTGAFSSGEAVLEGIKESPPDLVLLDVGLPGMNGIETLQRIRDAYPDVLVIMVTAYEDIDTVVSAMKLGAYDYAVKPIHMEGLEALVHHALESIRLRKEVQILQERYLKEDLPFFIGESNAMTDVMAFVEMVAKSPDTPVLILGETGTGKELIASAIHYRSPNFSGPFVTVNCAAIPGELIESELFGYEKGAFSGASMSGKKGLIEEAANGTLFLDEIGDLSSEAQAKLLRFLETGEFYRIGSTKTTHVQTRVVSATNLILDQLMENNRFRKDLYYRLAVIKVEVPSMNARLDDIMPLAKHFLVEFSRKFGKGFTSISQEAERALLGHTWTGNVRELRNVIERAVLIGKGQELEADGLGLKEAARKDSDSTPLFHPLPPDGLDLCSLENALQIHYINEALRLALGNESKAAALLRINHHTFRYRKKKLNIA